MHYKITLIFLLIIIFALVLYVYNICNYDPEIFMYKSIKNDNKFKILILGATHGNEPVGYYATKKLMDMFNLQMIKPNNCQIYIVPAVNICGFRTNSRYNMFAFDINRNYDTDSNINDQIKKIIKNNNIDLVIDIHEGFSFHKINKNSLGSTVTFNFDDDKLGTMITSNVNKSIKENNKKFIIKKYSELEERNGMLVKYCNENNVKYILMEITGQQNIQPIEIRIQQCMNILFSILYYHNSVNKVEI